MGWQIGPEVFDPFSCALTDDQTEAQKVEIDRQVLISVISIKRELKSIKMYWDRFLIYYRFKLTQ